MISNKFSRESTRAPVTHLVIQENCRLWSSKYFNSDLLRERCVTHANDESVTHANNECVTRAKNVYVTHDMCIYKLAHQLFI